MSIYDCHNPRLKKSQYFWNNKTKNQYHKPELTAYSGKTSKETEGTESESFWILIGLGIFFTPGMQVTLMKFALH